MRKADLLIIIGFFLLLLVAGITLKFYMSKAGQCVTDPLKYVSDSLGEQSYCSCVAWDGVKSVRYEVGSLNQILEDKDNVVNR